MKTYTSKAGGKLLYSHPSDERRDACGRVHLFSGYAEVYLTQDELEAFEEQSGIQIDSDQLPSSRIQQIVQYLHENDLLEGDPIAYPSDHPEYIGDIITDALLRSAMKHGLGTTYEMLRSAVRAFAAEYDKTKEEIDALPEPNQEILNAIITTLCRE